MFANSRHNISPWIRNMYAILVGSKPKLDMHNPDGAFDDYIYHRI